MLHLRAPRGGFLLEGNGGDGGDDAVDAELGRRGMAELVEHPVELGKTRKAAARRDIGNFHVGVQQQLLGVAHPGDLDVVDEREPCHPAELVRQE